MPFAVNSAGEFLSDGAKICSLFVSPDAAKRNFFYGVNFELGYEMPQFSLTQWNLEIRPIIGVRNADWEFIANPIVDVGFGSAGEADFAPALRLARNLGEDRFVGLEYYSDFGKIGDFFPLREQSQQLYAVTDFKLNSLDVQLGVGRGFTPGSDGLSCHQGHHRLRVSGFRQRAYLWRQIHRTFHSLWETSTRPGPSPLIAK